MKNLNFICLIIGLLVHTISKAENAPKWEIIGQVIEADSDIPLSYVTATLNFKTDSSMVMGTITDDDGTFKFSKLPEGDYYIKLSFIGFEDQIITKLPFNPSEKKISLGQIILYPSSNLLDEVIVQAKASSLSTSIDKQVLNVSQNIGASGGTAVDALKLSGSIQVDSDDQVKLRGSSNFIVLINGKPTSQNANDVLKQTPANQIKNIEIITNPSVKYRAEGGAGIINIILKKGLSQGMNGLVNGTLGTRNKYGADASMNWNKEKWSFSAGMNWRDFTKASTQEYDKSLVLPDTSYYGFMDQERSFRTSNLDFRFGANYDPNEKTSINYAFHSGYTKNELDLEVKTYGHTLPTSTEKHMTNTFDMLQNPVYYTNNLGIERSFHEGKRTINMNAYYSYIDYYLLTEQDMQVTNSSFEPLNSALDQLDVLNENNSNDIRLDVDYSQPINNQFKLETGVSLHSYLRAIDIHYSEFDNDSNEWVDNPNFTNKFDFNENIFGAYTNVTGAFKGIEMSFGLRAEYMDRLLDQLSSETNYGYQKLNWFPGFSFSKTLQDKHVWGLAMTNRINRPDEYYLNPYPEFEDDYFYSEGNPNVIPEIVRNLEFSYKNISDKAVLSANIFFRKTEDKISQLLVEGANKKLSITFHNAAMDRSLGIETMGNFNFKDWWSLNATLSGYQHFISGTVLNEEISKTNLVWTAQFVNAFQIKESTSVQIINYFSSATQEVQFEVSGFYFMDLGVKQTLLNGKLDIGVQFKDVLRSMNFDLITDAQNTHLVGAFGNESPIILLNVGYQISQYKKQTKDVQTEFDM